MKKMIWAIAALSLPIIAYAQDVPAPVETPPPPAKPRLVTVGKIIDSKLQNGVRVICVPRPGTGLVSATLLVKSGATTDVPAKAGTANMMAELLTKGTKTRSATQIAQSVEQLGASLSAGASYDSTSVSLSVLKTQLGKALPIMADVVMHPTFPEAEIKRFRTQTLDDLSVSMRQPGTLARWVAARVQFGEGTYGAPVGGTAQTLPRISQDDLILTHDGTFRPDNSVLVWAGDITPDQAMALSKQYFAGWKPTGKPKQIYPSAAEKKAGPSARRIVVIDRPDAGQAAVIIERLGISQSEPDQVVPELTNDILGGGYSSRLNREVRIKRGLSYGAGSALGPRRSTGPLVLSAQTKNESAGETARVLVDELVKLGEAPPTAEEITARKSALSGDFARSLETASGTAGLVAELALYNRPLSELQSYLGKVQAVTPDQVEEYAKTRFSASGANVIIVGNAAKFVEDLKQRFTGETVTVIPFANLDLNKADLWKGTP